MNKKIFFAIFLASLVIGLEAAESQAFKRNSLLSPRPARTSRPSQTVPVNAAPQKNVGADVAGAEGAKTDGEEHSLNWDQAPSELILQAYAAEVHKTLLIDPQVDVKKTITLKSEAGRSLSRDEFLEAIMVVLEMNQIHLEDYGEAFIKALPRKTVRNEGIPLIMGADSDKNLPETGKVVSMMIPFKHISAKEEAKEALDQFKSSSGILIAFERTNSILVTDTQQNINRMLEIARSIDIETPVLEQVFVRQIKYASAEEVKTFLEKIVEDTLKLLEKSGKGQQNLANKPASPTYQSALDRLRNKNQAPAPATNLSKSLNMSDADRGFIRGNVLILADERSNKLVIKSQPANMVFFDKVIQEIDVETTPDTVVKVYRLKYADSEDVSDMINDLIGNAPSGKNSKGSQNQNSKKGGPGGNLSTGSASARKSVNQRSGESKTGELNKDNTTVLSDKRINGLVVMTEKELVPTLEQIIESMDVKLSQVLIETVIIEVGLNDTIKTGVDWARGIQRNGVAQGIGTGGGNERLASATNTVAGGLIVDTAYDAAKALFVPGASGLNYAIASEKLDLAAVISLSKTDTNAKYLASPVIMTVDNKEATIEATEMRYLFKGYTYSGNTYSGSAVPDYEQKEIGITIKTTPKINPNGTVMLEVEEEYSQEGSGQEIEGQNSKKFNAATTVTRKMSSDVVLENGQTVVLGGLVDTYKKVSETGVPILKDIPWIGRYLFGKTENSEDRSELVIFMTPYVLTDAESAQAEALRRKKALADPHAWEDHGWSASALADPVSQKEYLRRLKDEWKKQDEERLTQLAIEKEKLERVKKLEKMSKEEREFWIEQHKEELEEEERELELKRIKDLEKSVDDKLLDKESQGELKKLAEAVRARKLKEANSEIKKADDQDKLNNVNEHDKLQNQKSVND